VKRPQAAPIVIPFPLQALPLLAEPAPAKAGVVGFLNVCTSGSASPKGGTIKTDHFLTGELRHYGVVHIRLVASS